MLKTFLAGATALAIAGGAYAYAQQSSTVGAGGEFQREHHLRDLAKQRSERFAARANADHPKDPIERMNLRAEVMGQRAAGLKKLADAAGPLYKSLDDGQKRRFALLARLDRGQMRAHRGGHHHGPRGGMMDNDGGR